MMTIMDGEIPLERLLAHLRAAIVSPGGIIFESVREDITAFKMLFAEAEGSFVELFVIDLETGKKSRFLCGYLDKVIIPDGFEDLPKISLSGPPCLPPEEEIKIMKAYNVIFVLRSPGKMRVSVNLIHVVTVAHEGKDIYENSSLNLFVFRKAREEEKKLFVKDHNGHHTKACA